MIITYTPDGVLAPDKRAYGVMKDLLDKGEDVAVGSDCLITALRLLIIEGYVQAKDVTIHFDEKVFQFDEKAQLDVWHEGFCDTIDNALLQLIKVRMNVKTSPTTEKESE